MTEKEITFLVVEDNDLDVEKITRGFKRLKIVNSMVRAENGDEALKILRGENPDKTLKSPYVILLDLNMPRMNGLEFLKELRADKTIAYSPVFVLTTSDRRDDIEAAHKHNVCGYIVKPIVTAQMLDALATLDMFWKLCKFPIGKVQASQ